MDGNIDNQYSNTIESNDCQYNNYLILYMDILGARNSMKDINSLLKIKNIYDFARNGINHAEEMVGGTSLNSNGVIHYKIFSDNIVAFIEYNSNSQINSENLDNLLHFAAVFQTAACKLANWLIRGSITIGNLYIDDDNVFVWGSGLLRAIELEENIAYYPRVILDPENPILIKTAKDLSVITPGCPVPITIGDDGIEYVDFEGYVLNCCYFDLISDIKKSLQEQMNTYISSHSNNEKIKVKLTWTIIYHNRVCEVNSLQEYIIEQDEIFSTNCRGCL